MAYQNLETGVVEIVKHYDGLAKDKYQGATDSTTKEVEDLANQNKNAIEALQGVAAIDRFGLGEDVQIDANDGNAAKVNVTLATVLNGLDGGNYQFMRLESEAYGAAYSADTGKVKVLIVETAETFDLDHNDKIQVKWDGAAATEVKSLPSDDPKINVTEATNQLDAFFA